MVTRDEWLQALVEAGYNTTSDDQALTALEFATLFDISCRRAHDRLNKLVRLGKAMRTTKSGITADGKHRIFVAFRLTSHETHTP